MRKIFVILIICLFAFFFGPKIILADTVSELLQGKADTQKQLDALLIQQQKLQTELDAIGKNKNTLQSNINALNASKAKLANDIKVTQSKITLANLNIQTLQNSVDEKQTQVDIHQKAISSAIRQLTSYDSNSLVMDVLNDKDLSEVWTDKVSLSNLQTKLISEIALLQDAQKILNQKKVEKEKTKDQLVGFKTELGGQKTAVEVAQADKNKLLTQTKGQEALYQKMLADNIAQEKKFEADLFNYESQLKITIDPSSIPGQRKGVLAWPLTNISITQFFGATVDAKRLYVSGSHGGIDLRASIGTPVFATLSGSVTDTEAFRIKSGCQYGKWVLIKHPNGLSTIYGHLSSVLVSPGQSVQTGQIIGYSGATGYSTGPHLHLGLYATAGIKIVDAGTLSAKSNCSGIKTVAAPPQAYLDPLAYLPSLN